MAFFPTNGGGLFNQGDFQIDQNSTPEMIRAKRAQLAALMPQYGKAKYVGEGIGQLAHGVMSGRRNRALDKFEGERSSEAAEQFNRIMSGQGDGGNSVGRGGPLSILGMSQPSQPNPDQEIANDTMAAIGKPQGGFDVREGLIERGMPEHVADAFVMNFKDESGLNPGINEANPIVPGSRGGFGLSQWTGPRRRQLEAFANQQGKPVSDPNVQLDFLMTELQGPEKAAAQAIFAAPDTGSAAAAIVNKFLRPAEEHRARREAKYTSGNSFQPGPGTQVAQNTYAGGPQLNDLMMAAQNPWLSTQQRSVINSQIQQMQSQQQAQQERQLKQQDPLYQAQLAQAQLNLEQDRAGITDSATVQTSQVLDDGTSVLVMNDGTRRVLSPTGEVVQGQAAADAIKAARDYTVENQRSVYAGRREGTLGADIELGGQAKAVEKVAEATVAAGVSAWEDYGKLQSSIGTINEAVAALDSGAQSGLIYKMLPNVTEASASLNNAMDRMGLDVVGSVTFGALSEGELRLAMNTAVPRDLSPPELRSWLVKKEAAQQKASVMLADAAQFMTKPGNTINMWIEKNRAAKGQAGQPETAAPPDASAASPETFEAFSATPSAQAAAQKYGVTLEEMWAIKQGQN